MSTSDTTTPTTTETPVTSTQPTAADFAAIFTTTEKPAVPTTEKPAVPTTEKPAVPTTEKPAVPTTEKPQTEIKPKKKRIQCDLVSNGFFIYDGNLMDRNYIKFENMKNMWVSVNHELKIVTTSDDTNTLWNGDKDTEIEVSKVFDAIYRGWQLYLNSSKPESKFVVEKSGPNVNEITAEITKTVQKLLDEKFENLFKNVEFIKMLSKTE